MEARFGTFLWAGSVIASTGGDEDWSYYGAGDAQSRVIVSLASRGVSGDREVSRFALMD
jgi:hypothetical protein